MSGSLASNLLLRVNDDKYLLNIKCVLLNINFAY
jgi:hypothetical protein